MTVTMTDVAKVDEATGEVLLSGVTKHFGGAAPAVDGLDLDIRAGEFLTLLGPSGCGKTTTLRMIAGFEHPDSGTISIDGQDVSRVPAFRRPVNTVFQQYALFPHLNVAKNIGYGLRHSGVGRTEQRQRVDDMLQMMEIGQLAERRPAQLSGGQQQRVALARALVMQPKVLLLDEPLGALDYKLRQTMQLELRRIHRELGTTFVFVTHDQEEALTMSDRICVMRAGRIEQLAEPQEIYDAPATVFVAGFVGQTNLLDSTVVASESTGETSVDVPGLGRLDGISARGVRPGSLATVCVRPEHVRLVGTDGGAGIVTESVLAGSQRTVIVAIGDNTTVRAYLNRDDRIVVGDRVAVFTDPRWTRIVAEEQG